MVTYSNRYHYARNGRIVKNCWFRSYDHKFHSDEHGSIYGTCWGYGSCGSYCSLYSKNVNLRSVDLVFCYVRSGCGSYCNVRWSRNFYSNLLGSSGLDGSLFENLCKVIQTNKEQLTPPC